MLGNMSTDSNPPVLEQSVDAPPTQPTVLSVAPEYLLESPVFAAPVLTLTPIHVLSVKGYLTGSLIWSTPAVVRWRQHVGSAGGHPYAISPEVAAKIIPMVELFVIEKQPTSDLKILGTTVQLVNYARKLAEAEGVTVVADVTLIRHVTRPALKNIKLKAAAEKATSTS
jgi:hypothetical protein